MISPLRSSFDFLIEAHSTHMYKLYFVKSFKVKKRLREISVSANPLTSTWTDVSVAIASATLCCLDIRTYVVESKA